MKHSTRLTSILTFGFIAFTFTATLSAQITGALRGTVSDSSGAAIPKGKVTLTNLETKAVRLQDVSSQGEFAFDLLTIGDYEVRAESPGFAASESRVSIETGVTKTVALKLEVGNVAQVVEVTTAVSQIDTDNAQLQDTVTGQNVQEIPVGRNPNLLALTAPGTIPVSPNNPYLGSGSFNANGGRGRGNNITVDGITTTDVSVTGTGGPLSPLNFSSIQDVTVITNNFSAEYGRNASAQVLYITKGGTNGLHGELYEYLQNSDLNARSFFDRSGHANISKINTYGFSVGGPVFIPKRVNWKNKVFWHVDYEGYKQRGVGATVIATVPTPAQLASITDPTSLAIAKQYQIPTSPTGTLPETGPATTNTWQQGYRGDVVVSKNDTLWARYAVYNSYANSSGNTFITSNLPYFGAGSTNHPRQATLAETHLFGPNAVNEFRFGFGESQPNFPIQTPYTLGPEILFQDGTFNNAIGVSSILPQGRSQYTYQYTDNFTLTHGAHKIKMGFEWYHLNAPSFFDSNLRGTYTFANFAAFAAGTLTQYTQNFGTSARDNVIENAFSFVQDDWKVTRNLTVNLGVRLEFAGGPTEANGEISNLNLDNHSAFGAAGAGIFGVMESGKPSFHSNYNWAPRVGFAWQPHGDQKTVIRGGYGIAYDFVFLNPITNQRFLPPFIYSGSLGAGSFTGANSYANLYAGTAAYQKSLASGVGTLSTTFLNFGSISPAIAQNLRNPQVQQRSIGIERQLMRDMVLKVTYVGTKGTYLERTRPINFLLAQPAPATSYADETARLSQFTSVIPGLTGTTTSYSNRYDGRYNGINYVESSAESEYNGLQVEFSKRFGNRYTANAAYTWSHSIDDVSDVLGVLANDSSAQQNPNDNHNNRAASQFDVRQTLVVWHVYELPFFLGSSNRLLRGALGGWSFAGITTLRSGFPINIFAGATVGGMSDPLQYLGSGNTVDRPNVGVGPIVGFHPIASGAAGAPSGTTVVNGVAISNYALSLGLTQPLVGNYGNLGRNVLRLNGQNQFDWDFFKNFHFSEKVNFQIRAEFYNLFNQHAFLNMGSSNITSPSFGVYTQVSQNARTAQVAARVVF